MVTAERVRWSSAVRHGRGRCRGWRAVRSRQAADSVVHYVPTAGGVVFGGYAICGAHRCPNILVRSDLSPSLDRDPYDPSTSDG